MYYIDSNSLKNTGVAPVSGQSFYLQVKNILIYLIKNKINIEFSAINGQVITSNSGYDFNDTFTVLVFDDGNKQVYSKIKKININEYEVIKDISGLDTSKITIYYPPLNIEYNEIEDVFIFKNNRKFSLKDKNFLQVWLDNGESISKSPSSINYGVNYLSDFNLIYNDNCIISNAFGGPGNNTATYLFVINEIDHMEINGTVNDIDSSYEYANANACFFSSFNNYERRIDRIYDGENVTFQRMVFNGIPSTKLRSAEGGTSFATKNNFNLIKLNEKNKCILLVRCVKDSVILFDYNEV